MEYKATAPATFMLFGEHAVLNGYPAIISPIKDKNITVSINPRNDQMFSINSENYGFLLVLDLEDVNDQKFTHVLEIIKFFKNLFPISGLNIEIKSNFSSNLGIGSSAAITIALVTAMSDYIKSTINVDVDIFDSALKITRKIQGKASGADLACAIHNQTIYYIDGEVTKIDIDQFLLPSLVYMGYKTPTKEVIDFVDNSCDERIKDSIYSAIGRCVELILRSINKQDLESFAYLCKTHNHLQEALHVVDVNQKNVIQSFEDLGCHAKVSGAGLGDCVVVFKCSKDVILKTLSTLKTKFAWQLLHHTHQ